MKQVSELKSGDKITLHDGSIVKINSISKGWWPNSKFLNFSNGQWACMKDTAQVEISN